MRDTNAGDGIVFVNGVQKTFSLQQHWQSSVPPKVGGAVEVVLDTQGGLQSLAAVDETMLAKEQAQQAMEIVGKYGRLGLNEVLAKVSPVVLACLLMLALSWIFLNTVTVNLSAATRESASLYDILRLANAGGELDGIAAYKYRGAGFYGFLMWLCILAPLASHFHPNKYLPLTYCAPLLFLLGTGWATYSAINQWVDRVSALGNMFGGSQASQMAERMAAEMLNNALRAISLGFGLYLSGAIAIVLAVLGIKKFLVNNAA